MTEILRPPYDFIAAARRTPETLIVPSQSELIDLWASGYAAEPVPHAALPGIYSVYRVPETPPAAIVSVDLCEVVRHTCGAVAKAGGITLQEMSTHPRPDAEKEGADYGFRSLGLTHRTIWTAVYDLMEQDQVEPVEDIAYITAMLQNWREQNVYCVANTSTLPSCEPATIKFLKKHLPDSFDGIVFPRTPIDDAMHASQQIAFVTKSAALDALVTQISDGRPPLVHIDDILKHATDMKERFGPDIDVFTPAYPWNSRQIEGVSRHPSPLETFAAVHATLRSKGVLV